MNKPPAAASKIVTLTTSPMPNLISGGGRWSPNRAERVRGPYSSRVLTTPGVSVTRPYGGPFQVTPDLTESALGPASGNSWLPQPAHKSAPPKTANTANLRTPHILPTSGRQPSAIMAQTPHAL